MNDDLNVIEHDDGGLIVNGVRYVTVAEVHRCGLCETEQMGDYREDGTWWQCRACGAVFEVGVTW